jgi:esterase
MHSTLHHALLRPEGDTADRALLSLHGILGTGPNLRPVAQALVAADPRQLVALVDLRQHGRSQGFAAPHSVDAAAADLTELEPKLPLPVRGVLGHSFGGKVAVAFHARRPDLERVILLDSNPGARPDRSGSADTLEVLSVLERAPASFTRRDEFLAYLREQGLSRMISDWLAMNLERTESGFRLRLELPSIRALLEDYFVQDLWHVLERSQAKVDVVVGGRSKVFDASDRERLAELERSTSGRIKAHVLPAAGHWVHVDDPAGVAAAVAPR